MSFLDAPGQYPARAAGSGIGKHQAIVKPSWTQFVERNAVNGDFGHAPTSFNE
jgi:hypothetical protein